MSGDDRDRNGQRQHAGDGARGADQSTPRTDRHLVSVPHRRHGDDRPPEAVRDALDLRAGLAELLGGGPEVEIWRRRRRLGLAELGVVDGARVDQQADDERDEEQTQTLKTGLQRHLVARASRHNWTRLLASFTRARREDVCSFRATSGRRLELRVRGHSSFRFVSGSRLALNVMTSTCRPTECLVSLKTRISRMTRRKASDALDLAQAQQLDVRPCGWEGNRRTGDRHAAYTLDLAPAQLIVDSTLNSVT